MSKMRIIGIYLFVIVGFALTISNLISISRKDKESTTYTRVSNCILSIAPGKRTQKDVENCYRSVQEDAGVTLKRYDH